MTSSSDVAEATRRAEALGAAAAAAAERFDAERRERRRLANALLELKGNVRAFVRVRPLSAAERDRGECAALVPSSPSEVRLNTGGGSSTQRGRATVRDGRGVRARGVAVDGFRGGGAARAKRARRIPRVHLRVRTDGQRKDAHDGRERGGSRDHVSRALGAVSRGGTRTRDDEVRIRGGDARGVQRQSSRFARVGPGQSQSRTTCDRVRTARS